MPTPFYLIHIRDLRIDASVGFHAFEREARQAMSFYVTLILEDPGTFQDRRDAITDYDIVRQTVQSLCDAQHWELLETLSSTIADKLLGTAGVLGVVVESAKTGVYEDTKAAACRLARLSDALPDDFPWWSAHV